jgi:NAD(P)-dependent dehydrogenase (short-subunit alcohol dehydrogenase family)
MRKANSRNQWMKVQLGSMTNSNGSWQIYSCSKVALNMLMKGFAARRPDDPRALLLVAPGWVRTNMGGTDALLSIEESIPLVVDLVEANRGKPGRRYLDRFKLPGLIHAAGVSPSQASPATILKVDLYGTALVLEQFGNVIARGGAGVVIASQSGHRLPSLTVEQNRDLATTPVEDLLRLPFLQPDKVTDSLHAYQISKRGNSLRVMAEAVRWGKRGARINTISPGIIMTPLAKDELTGPRGAGYRRMIEVSAAARAGTPDEVGTIGALLMGPDGGFITGSDFLMDGGVTAAYWYGDLAPQ